MCIKFADATELLRNLPYLVHQKWCQDIVSWR